MSGDGEMLFEKKFDVLPGTLDPHVMEEEVKYEPSKEGLFEAVLRRLARAEDEISELRERVRRLEGKEE